MNSLELWLLYLSIYSNYCLWFKIRPQAVFVNYVQKYNLIYQVSVYIVYIIQLKKYATSKTDRVAATLSMRK